MFEIVLYQPEIPPNSGNIIRLCANSGCRLHLVHPLGYSLEDRQLRRAGLDYRDLADVVQHQQFADCQQLLAQRRWFALSTRGRQRYDQVAYQPGDVFLFGPETRGLPDALLDALPAEQRLCIPMVPGSRSLNLGNAVAVTMFEAWRQQDYAGAVRHP